MTVRDDSADHGLKKFSTRQLAKKHPLEVSNVLDLNNNLEMGYNNHVVPRINFMLPNPISIPRRTFVSGTGLTPLGSGSFGVGQLLGTFGPWPATILKDNTVAPVHIQAACHTGGESVSASANTSVARNYLVFEYLPVSQPSRFPSLAGDSVGVITLTHAAGDLTSSWRNLDAVYPNSLLVYRGLPGFSHDNIKLNDSGAPTTNDCILMKLNMYSVQPDTGGTAINTWVIPQNVADKSISFQGLIVRETAYSEDNF